MEIIILIIIAIILTILIIAEAIKIIKINKEIRENPELYAKELKENKKNEINISIITSLKFGFFQAIGMIIALSLPIMILLMYNSYEKNGGLFCINYKDEIRNGRPTGNKICTNFLIYK